MSHAADHMKSSHSSQARQTLGLLALLLAVTASVRLIGITRPLLGNFATKQAVYGMIARNWALGRTDHCHPALDVLAGGQRSWHLVEYPVSAYLTGGLWRVFGGRLDVWGRATAVAFSVGSVALMFWFVRRRHGLPAAMAAALALALSPVSIIYGQSFMLEASLVFFTLATFCALARWLDGGGVAWLIGAGVLLALLLLTKIYMLVMILPLAAMVLRSDRKRAWLARTGFAATLVLAVLPAALWCGFAYQTASPDGPFAGRVFYGVRQSAAAHFPPHPLLGAPDFYAQVLDDLSGVVLTPVGFMLLLAGLLHRQCRQHLAWLVAVVALVLLLPRKFHEMNYYYLAVLPPLCILIGLGWEVVRQRLRPGRWALGVLVGVAVLFALRHAVKPAFVTPDEDRGVIEAARAVRQLTAEEEPVATMHGTTIDLLYYCNRCGWALHTPDLAAALEDCRRQGARYLVVVGDRPPGLSEPLRQAENFHVYRLAPALLHPARQRGTR